MINNNYKKLTNTRNKNTEFHTQCHLIAIKYLLTCCIFTPCLWSYYEIIKTFYENQIIPNDVSFVMLL